MELTRVHSVVITSIVRLNIVVKLTQKDVTCEHLLSGLVLRRFSSCHQKGIMPRPQSGLPSSLTPPSSPPACPCFDQSLGSQAQSSEADAEYLVMPLILMAPEVVLHSGCGISHGQDQCQSELLGWAGYASACLTSLRTRIMAMPGRCGTAESSREPPRFSEAIRRIVGTKRSWGPYR